MSKKKVKSEPGFNWFAFNVLDWLTDDDVRSMTAAETGIYITLLAVQWRDNGLPVEFGDIAKLLKFDRRVTVRFLERYSKLFPIFREDRRKRVNRKLLDLAVDAEKMRVPPPTDVDEDRDGDEDQLVSKSIGSVPVLASLESTGTTDSAPPRDAPPPAEEQEQNQPGGLDQEQEQPPALDGYEAAVRDFLGHTLHEEFGLPYTPAEYEPDLALIAKAACFWCPDKVDAKTTALWAKSLARWAKQHKHWSKCTPTVAQLAKHMQRQDEKGICAQFNVARAKKQDKAAGL